MSGKLELGGAGPPDKKTVPPVSRGRPPSSSTPTPATTTEAEAGTSHSNGDGRPRHDDTVGVAELLETLNYRDDEFVAICHQKPGGNFRTSVMAPETAPHYVGALGCTVDTWSSVNPTAGPARADCGRGTAEQATRLAGLFADLDIKPGGCADMATAEAVIDEASALLGTRPAIVVASGHGLQPHWPVEDGDITDTFTTNDAAALLDRFGRLVEIVADNHGAKVDNVFEPARVLRVPGTVNHKEADPVPVTARRDTGGPLTVAEVDERLTELGICQDSGDTASEPLSDPDGWEFAWQTCPYVATMINGWATDGPKPGKGRNPWVCNQAVRLHCALMVSCITEQDFRRAEKLLEQRLTHLLASTEPRRRIRKFEMRDAFKLGRERASCKTEEQARAELGGHPHQEPPPDVDDHHTGEWTGEQPPPSDQAEANESRLTPLLLTRSALRQLPDPEPLIDDVLDQATNALLYGYWGTCKTFIALDWAASVATGRPWQGHTTQQRRVLYIAAEGAFGLKARIDAWEQGWHQSISDDDLHILPRPLNLTHYGELAELVTLIQQNGYGFVVIDTLACCMVGADENSAKDCGEVVAALLRLRQATPEGRGCVAGVHHTGKDGKTFRGSSVFEAGADTVYAVSADEAVINLDRQKRRDGPKDDHHELKFDLIDGSGSGVISVHRGVDKPTAGTSCCPPLSTISVKREQARPSFDLWPTWLKARSTAHYPTCSNAAI